MDTRIVSLLLVAGAAACATPTAVSDSDQVYLFEVEYASSWFPTWTGVVIDRNGRVIRYRREETPWVPADPANIAAGELETKYAAERSVVAQLDAEIMAVRFGQIDGVGSDFTEPNHVCADAGSLRYTAYRYDADGTRYRPVMLREEGDAPTANRGGTAPTLAAWLRSVLLDLEVENVQPFQDACIP